MAYINIENIKLSFSGTPLFDGIGLTVERGEKIALLGRNGSGKSTLLKLIEGNIKPDSGNVSILKGIRCTRLSQIVPPEIPGTVFELVASGVGLHSDLINRYETVSNRLTEEDTQSLHEELGYLHNMLQIEGLWEKRQQVNKVISKLGLNARYVFNNLSAGLKRQALLGRALVGEPDILLLDEPTNHMDIDSIKRLEDMIMRFAGSLIFVTHDRTFLQKIATRIVEIDRGHLFDQSCDYTTYMLRREADLEAEKTQNALFDKKLAKEEQWVRQGIKARRTRNEGRVRELQKMRDVRRSRRERPGAVRMEVNEAERSGKLVAKIDGVNFGYNGNPVISKFSTTIMKGDRVGILGPNGCGKTSLLRIILGELPPISGNIRLGSNLQISYSDQLRDQLDENKTLMQNIADGYDTVTINGKTRHIMGYMQDFLFTPDRARSSVSLLSGGERNRLLLARLLAKPSNLLVLDEPTNDLDTETLELLEEFLMEYTGTILMVSHDRTFINNVVTSTLVFEGNAIVNEYAGGYDDWLSQRPPLIKQKSVPAVKNNTSTARQKSTAAYKKDTPQAKTLKTKPAFGYRQEKELNLLPQTIEALEMEQKELIEAMGDPGFYKNDKPYIIEVKERLESVNNLLISAYKRWEELEILQSGI